MSSGTNNEINIIVFLPKNNAECRFPASPDEVLKFMCSIHIVNYASVEALKSDTVTKHLVYDFDDYRDERGLLDVIATHVTMKGSVIFSVHPKAVLLTLYRWAYMRNAKVAPNTTVMQLLKNRCVDLCEEFYNPTILSLEKREAFSCFTMAKWLHANVKDFDCTKEEDCIKIIKSLCQILI
jgi:hypothetical protein